MQHFGIIGHPLGHSLSPAFYRSHIESAGISASYELCDALTLSDAVRYMQQLDGANITAPYKQSLLPYLTEVEAEARAIGAVNVVKNGKGYNTDWHGVVSTIEPYLPLRFARALVLGTGGASRAVEYALNKLGISVTFVSRQAKAGAIRYTELTQTLINEHSLIVNCTPLGMAPLTNSAPDIPYNYITRYHLLFDCIYNPTETLFLRLGKERGATTVNGYNMFLTQAVKAWEIFSDPRR